MKFFADHCVSNSIIQALRDAGHQVDRLGEHLPVESEDSLVIGKAQELKAILLSLNGDFADIVAFPPSNFCGIVAFQMRNQPGLTSALMERFLGYLELHPSADHYRGKLIWVEPGRMRVRS
ncbi:MAG: DUF5615 family PIN-like protein [Terriglobia bacterium]